MSLCLVIRPAILGAIGLLDRLSRNLAFIATLMDSGTKFVAVDNPHANRLTLHIFAAVAHHEREMIAARTKAALQASKARGTRLGSNGAEKLAPAYRAEAEERAKAFAPIITDAPPRACLRALSLANWKRKSCPPPRWARGTRRPCCMEALKQSFPSVRFTSCFTASALSRWPERIRAASDATGSPY